MEGAMVRQRYITEIAEMLQAADQKIAEKVILSSGQPFQNNINDINNWAETEPLFGRYGLYPPGDKSTC